jgi:hypothetical protein
MHRRTDSHPVANSVKGSHLQAFLSKAARYEAHQVLEPAHLLVLFCFISYGASRFYIPLLYEDAAILFRPFPGPPPPPPAAAPQNHENQL